jgi:hypothetical protein
LPKVPPVPDQTYPALFNPAPLKFDIEPAAQVVAVATDTDTDGAGTTVIAIELVALAQGVLPTAVMVRL